MLCDTYTCGCACQPTVKRAVCLRTEPVVVSLFAALEGLHTAPSVTESGVTAQEVAHGVASVMLGTPVACDARGPPVVTASIASVVMPVGVLGAPLPDADAQALVSALVLHAALCTCGVWLQCRTPHRKDNRDPMAERMYSSSMGRSVCGHHVGRDCRSVTTSLRPPGTLELGNSERAMTKEARKRMAGPSDCLRRMARPRLRPG